MQDLMSLIRKQSKLISSLQKTIEVLNAKLELSEKSKVVVKDVIESVIKDVNVNVDVGKNVKSLILGSETLKCFL